MCDTAPQSEDADKAPPHEACPVALPWYWTDPRKILQPALPIRGLVFPQPMLFLSVLQS